MGADEGLHQFAREGGSDDPSPEHEDVHVVVLDSLVCGVDVMTDRGAHPLELVRGHRGADAAAADEHAPLGSPIDHGLAHGLGRIGVIDGGGGMGAHIDHLVAFPSKKVGHLLLKRETRVIGTHHDLHDFFAPAICSLAAATTSSRRKPNFF